jgi:hypothetical protein
MREGDPMAGDRTLRNKQRRAGKVRGELITTPQSAITNSLLSQDVVPKHLQTLKENYEASIVADEVQKQKRLKANQTIRTMADSAVDASVAVEDKSAEGVENLDARPMRATQRAKAIDAIDELTKITRAALQDGLEEGALRVNEIADSDPRAQDVADTSVEIDDLTWQERLSGKVRRKK